MERKKVISTRSLARATAVAVGAGVAPLVTAAPGYGLPLSNYYAGGMCCNNVHVAPNTHKLTGDWISKGVSAHHYKNFVKEWVIALNRYDRAQSATYPNLASATLNGANSDIANCYKSAVWQSPFYCEESW